MTIEEFQNITISLYRNVRFYQSEKVTIGAVLDAIRHDSYKTQILAIRTWLGKGDVVQAGVAKGQLPAVTFSAFFGERRQMEFCKVYTGVLVIDIDKLGADEMKIVGEQLRNDEYVVSCWRSPSGNGWKGLVVLEFPEDKNLYALNYLHRMAFLQIENYFRTKYGIALDKSGKDIPRLCYMSHDADLILKTKVVSYPIQLDALDFEIEEKIDAKELKEVVQHVGKKIESSVVVTWNVLDGQGYPNPYVKQQKEILFMIYRYLKKKGRSITESYEDWVKVAFAIANTFHPVYGRSMFMKLCELDGAKHDADRSERLIYDAYTAGYKLCTFKTIVYFAEKKGFKYNP